MNIKQTIGQVLLVLGAVAGFFGLANLTGAITFVTDNLDTVWAAGLTIVGFVTALIGYFKHTPVPEVGASSVESTKATIGQILMALGAIAALLGLTKFTEILNFLLTNLDTVVAAGLTVVGFVVGLIGYFKTKK